ncbi:MAG: c-type cytochrome [Desulfatiglans sp.]|jgi:cytochrome c551/c552|nr:c-type cytochrome [Desulfatiglans sp.]
MKTYLILILFTILIFYSFSTASADDKSVYDSLKCGICHKADTGKTYPSLIEISKAYNGDTEKLVKYFQGKSEPIMNLEKAKSMEKFLEKTKALSEDELNSLVEFILSHEE